MTDRRVVTSPTPSAFHGWNLADLFEALADHLVDEPAIIEADRTISWRRMDQRADRMALHLLEAGLGQQARVAVCAQNGAAFIESYVACFKAGLVPFNVNYRYHAAEMAYLLTNADAEAVIGDASFADTVTEAVELAGTIATTVWVGDGADDLDGSRYEEIVEVGDAAGRTVAPWGRTPGDQLFQYTGGTTGRPKAAIWRQCDLVDLLAGTTTPPGEEVVRSEADMVERIEAPPRRSLSAAPLMHGTGMLSQLANMMTGGAMVVAPGVGFDAATTLAAVERERVEVLVIVGDTFSLPILAELERPGATHDLSSLKMITSAGAMWSRPVKARLLAQLPSVALFDAFGSTECSGLGVSVSSVDDLDDTAQFRAGEFVRVLGDDGQWIEPGSGQAGRVATTGPIPIGYHKDPERSRATFPEIDGVRYAVPGDLVTVEADGSLTFLGRGSSCITTGGEKVHPEEVEERLKEHPSVVDAACLGAPDPRFGQMVVGLVALDEPGAVDEQTLIAHVRASLAGYKTPKHVFEVASLDRSPSAKLDLRHLAAVAYERLGLDAPAPVGR